MTLSISFYDGVKYHGPDFNQRDADFYGNGVLYPGTSQFSLTYPTTPNMTFTVGQGVAWVDGYRIANDSNGVTLTVPAADATNPRIDIVQLGHDDINSTYSLVVKKGVAQASPVEPGADASYIKLYAISVAANATSITSGNVTDKRAVLPLNVNGSQISQAGTVSNTDPAYTNVKNGAYVVAGTGITATAGTNQETVAVSPATTATLGGVKVGSGISVLGDGTISVTPYTLPVATSTVLGGVKQGSNITIAGDGTISGSAPYSLPVATSSVLGGVKQGSGVSIAGDGTLSVTPYSPPATMAKTDTIQTWTAAQTFNAAMTLAANQTFTNNGRITGGTIDATTVPWSGVTSKPTTVSTFGITDALTTAQLGATSGVASLDGTGNVPASQLGNVPPANILTNPLYRLRR